MSIAKLNIRIEELQKELVEVLTMSEREFHESYNEDSRDEYEAYLREEISNAEGDIEALKEDEECNWRKSGIDEGFADEADYLRYKFG